MFPNRNTWNREQWWGAHCESSAQFNPTAQTWPFIELAVRAHALHGAPRMVRGGEDLRRWASPCPAPAGLKSCRLELEERNVLVLSFPLRPQRVPPSLTSAERDVVRRALAGASNAQIARARGSSARTVANQLGAIYRKLGIFSRTELAQRFASTDLDDES